MNIFRTLCLFALLGGSLLGGYAQTNLVSFDEAMAGAAAAVEAKIPKGYEIAFAEFTAPLPAISKFLNDELDQRFSNTGNLTVLARGRTLQQVSKEQKLQMSGLVDDNSAAGIGNQLGAKAVITGTFERFSDFSQFRIRVVEVRTAKNLAAYSARIRSNDPILASITKPLQSTKPTVITENALDYLNRGKDYFAEGKYDQAVAEFDKALGINQDLSEAYFYRGNAYGYKGDYDKAIANFTAVLRIDPNDAKAYIIRGFAYNNKGDYDKAIADYTAALRIDPNFAGAYYSRGVAYGYKGDYNKAIADYTAALRIDPNFADAYGNRGMAYGAKGDYDRAIADFTAALLIDPQVGALIWRGAAYHNKGDYDKAIADYTMALRIDPNDANTYNIRGWAYRKKGDFDRAIADFAEASRLDPSEQDYRDNLQDAKNAYAQVLNDNGIAYYNRKDYDRTIAECTAALRINPQYADAYNNRGVAYMNKRDFDRGIADFTEASRLDPSNQFYRDNLQDAKNAYAQALNDSGAAYYNKKDYDRAIAECTAALRINPNYAGALVWRGAAYYNKGDYDKAIADFTAAIRLDPSNQGYQNWLQTAQNAKAAAAPVNPQPVPTTMVRINGGTFTMGSPASEPGREHDETQHSVTVSSFYMGKYEVTQKEYRELMGTNPSKFKGDNLPVEQVSWSEAIDYCNARSRKEGLTPAYTINGNNLTWSRSANGYRLPTEAEWEYACRAGTTTPFNTGNTITTNQANYDGDTYREKTTAVGSFAPNAWGLYDMHGNVWEWCWDAYGAYAAGTQTDPAGPDSGPAPVKRGGGWYNTRKWQRSAYRFYGAPVIPDSSIGFRVVRNGN